jgi:hypothetical protein
MAVMSMIVSWQQYIASDQKEQGSSTGVWLVEGMRHSLGIYAGRHHSIHRG